MHCTPSWRRKPPGAGAALGAGPLALGRPEHLRPLTLWRPALSNPLPPASLLPTFPNRKPGLTHSTALRPLHSDWARGAGAHSAQAEAEVTAELTACQAAVPSTWGPWRASWLRTQELSPTPQDCWTRGWTMIRDT